MNLLCLLGIILTVAFGVIVIWVIVIMLRDSDHDFYI